MSEHVNGAVVDLLTTLPNDTAELHMVVPGSNQRTGWVITMAGPGHPKTVALNNETSRKQLLLEQRIEQARVNGRKFKSEDKQPDDNRREFIESLVARMVTWTWQGQPALKIGDEDIVFSDKAAVELLLRPVMGLYVAQIVDAVVDERFFMKGSATN